MTPKLTGEGAAAGGADVQKYTLPFSLIDSYF